MGTVPRATNRSGYFLTVLARSLLIICDKSRASGPLAYKQKRWFNAYVNFIVILVVDSEGPLTQSVICDGFSV